MPDHLTVVLLASLSLVQPAAAQEPHALLGFGAAVSPWQPASISSGASLSFGNESAERWAPGVQLEAAALLSDHVAVGAEFVLPLRRTVQQSYSYFGFGYRAEIRYRELPLLATLHVGPGGRTRGIGLVVGAGPVRQDGFERHSPQLGFTGQFGPFAPEVHSVRWTWGAMAGADVSVPVGRRLSLVPQLRAIFVERGETAESDAFADLGLPAVSLRVAITVRVQR